MPHKIGMTLGLLLLGFGCFAQSSLLNCHQLSPEDGLSQSDNASFYLDQLLGYAWIGSTGGLNRFDGKSVRVFKPEPQDSNSIQGVSMQGGIFEDDQHRLWLTTDEAINCYDPQEDRFISAYAKGKNAAFRSVHRALYLENQRYLWCSADKQCLYRIDLRTFETDTLRHPVAKNFRAVNCAMETTEQGTVRRIYAAFWNARQGIEVMDFAEGQLQKRQVWFDRVGHPAPRAVEVSKAILGSNGGAWLATDQGLIFFDPEAPDDYRTYLPPSSNRKIRSMILVANELWLITDQAVIYRFDCQNRVWLNTTFQLYNLDQKKHIDQVDDLLAVQDSILWFSAKGQGVFYTHLNNQRFHNWFNENRLPPESIVQVFEYRDGRIECSNKIGQTWQFDADGQFLQQSKAPSNAKKFYDCEGQLWEYSNLGLCKIQPSGKQLHIQPDHDQLLIAKVIPLNCDTFLLGTNRGILSYDRQRRRLDTLDDSGWEYCLYRDAQNRLWSNNTNDLFRLWDCGE
ncbi:MAG: hypothetical protein AAGD05_07015, partial [Bacteroidota bacterium]